MEYHQITINEWFEMKKQLRQELNNVRTSFVRVGYVLRKMNDSEAYKAEGYASIAEFAEKEHGLKPSTTSRWMSINKEYSLDGYSMQLDPKWADRNASQLTEMLALPAEDRELVTPDMKRDDIRELKHFNKEAEKWKGEPEQEDGLKELIAGCVDKKPEIGDAIREYVRSGSADPKHLAELIAPSGSTACRAGKIFVFFTTDHIKIKKFGADKKEVVSWEEFAQSASDWLEGQKVYTEDIAEEKGEENVGRYDSGRGDAGDDGGTEGNAPGKAGSDSAGAHEDGGYNPAGRNETHEDGEGSGSESADDKEGECESAETEIHETGDPGSFGEIRSEETACGVPEDTADQVEEEESGDVIEGINTPSENVENVDESEIARAQFAEESVENEGQEEPEVIVDEDGKPSPEDAEAANEARKEKVRKARDKVNELFALIELDLDEHHWPEAEEKTEKMLKELAYLRNNDDETAAKRIKEIIYGT